MTETRAFRSERTPANAAFREIIPAGEPWIHEIRIGQYLRIVDLHGNQAVDTVFYNAHDYSDRCDAQATITQHRECRDDSRSDPGDAGRHDFRRRPDS